MTFGSWIKLRSSPPEGAVRIGVQALSRTDYALIALVMAVFWCAVLRQIELPGLYMDAVNPDYLAARILNRELPNPVWVIPTATIPILGNLYHGVQNLYVDLLAFPLLGMNVTTVRLTQAAFGAAILLCFYLLVLRSTGSRLAACGGAVLLASDIAFTASFRTQNYIVLGGETWLFASLLALGYGKRPGHFLSGVFFGLSIYGYFVLGFFAPAMMLLVGFRKEGFLRTWIAGVCVGLLPYLAGYLSLFWALGGLSNGIEWIRQTVQGLAPLSAAEHSLLANAEVSLRDAAFALANVGNERMILSGKLAGDWAPAKGYLFLALICVALIGSRKRDALRIVFLPLSFFAIACLLGSRLGAHHFSVLVPLFYLLLSVLAGVLMKSHRLAVVVGLCALLFAAANVDQANHFHAKLNQTGGTRMTTNALSQLAEDARRTPDTLYVFPEWGFFTSFGLLTENKVRYVLDTQAIAATRADRKAVAVAYWSEQNTQQYADALISAGAVRTSTSLYRRRDGKTAFLVTTGIFQ